MLTEECNRDETDPCRSMLRTTIVGNLPETLLGYAFVGRDWS
jgi:hypothetical protein